VITSTISSLSTPPVLIKLNVHHQFQHQVQLIVES